VENRRKSFFYVGMSRMDKVSHREKSKKLIRGERPRGKRGIRELIR